jgi:hypothetical protein
MGPRETWYEPDKYEFVLFDGTTNSYSMLQPLLDPTLCTHLEYVGNCNPLRQGVNDVPMYLGVFETSDERYDCTKNMKFLLTEEFVSAHFSRYETLCKLNPNRMMSLLRIAELDRGFDAKDRSLYQGWLQHPLLDTEGQKFRFWANKPADLISIVQGKVKNLYRLLYIPGSRWRFFGRFNSKYQHWTKSWIQLDEKWMSKYLKPECLKDMHLHAAPYVEVDVELTGKKGTGALLKCVKQAVLQVIPDDDLPVLEAIALWPDELYFTTTPNRLQLLSRLSTKYQYNAIRLTPEELVTLFDDTPWTKDMDILIRPSDKQGMYS